MIKSYLNSIRNNPEKYWFKRKRYGWGWTPARWQGWIVLSVYIVAVFIFAASIDESLPVRKQILTFLLPIILLTLLMITICYRTGEKPKWQWGLPKDR